MSKPQLLFATGNPGKLVELRQLLADVEVEVVSLADMDVKAPEVIEDADSFRGNANKKALELSAFYRLPALADDSGLCVDALGGRPGVYSARFAGPEASDADNNQQLLKELAEVAEAERGAHFRSVLSFADVGGRLGRSQTLTAAGVCHGQILEAPRGTGGFGYDPLFLLPQLGQTFAELGVGTKNDRSHRAQAMRAMKPQLLKYFGL